MTYVQNGYGCTPGHVEWHPNVQLGSAGMLLSGGLLLGGVTLALEGNTLQRKIEGLAATILGAAGLYLTYNMVNMENPYVKINTACPAFSTTS